MGTIFTRFDKKERTRVICSHHAVAMPRRCRISANGAASSDGGKEAGRDLQARGVKFVYRSEVTANSVFAPSSVECLLVNTTGELKLFYEHAWVIFVGKSLTAQGGLSGRADRNRVHRRTWRTGKTRRNGRAGRGKS